MGTHRTERLQEEIRHLVSEILLYEVTDPLVHGVTVTRVLLTKDIGLARIYYNARGTAKERKSLQQGLERASSFVRRQVAPKLNLKIMPQIEFFYDETEDELSRVDLLFMDLNKSKN